MTTAVEPRPEVRFCLKRFQHAIFCDPSRFRVLVAGRRFGKTFLDAVELIVAASREAKSRNWYVAPTHEMAREIMWKQLKELIPPRIVSGSPNETYLSIELVNGSEIGLRSADRPDRLRGRGLDLVIPDEAAQMPIKVWEEVLRPALADRGGRALFTTTPAGYNFVYDLYMKGIVGEDGWRSWQFTTLDGGLVPESEIQAARRDLDPRIFRQEYEASFEALSGRVYANYSREWWPDGNVDPEILDPGGEILVGMDFNVNPMSAVIAVRAVDECYVLKAIQVPTSNTTEMATEIKRLYPDRSIVVCPDPSGRSRKTSAPVGQTDFTILERAGFKVRAPNAAPPIKDRINNTQAMLLSADGARRLRMHPLAQSLMKSLDGLTYKEGTSQPDKSLGLDHMADALDYLLWQEFNVLGKRFTVETEEWRV